MPISRCEAACHNPHCTDLPNPDEHFGPTDGFGPAMTDGYWLMTAPLTPGPHTLHFQGTHSGITVDVTYQLTVK